MSEEGKSLEELREQRDHFAEKLTVLRRKLDVCGEGRQWLGGNGRQW